MKKILVLSALICLLSSLKCKKDKYPPAVLPAITQTGQNTVGFTIDGNVWVPYYECGFGRNPCGKITGGVSYPYASAEGISFQFSREHNGKVAVLTISTGNFRTITSIGDKIDSISVDFQSESYSGNNFGVYGGHLSGSKFIVTKFDRQNQIISGEFELVLLEQNGSGKTITISDGRFDFKFNACLCDR